MALIHYLPLEYYPPATNMLNYLGQSDQLRVKVWSTKNIKNRPTYHNPEILHIIRTSLPKPRQNKMLRLLSYLWFNLRAFWGLLIYNPDSIFYYETYSAGPVYWYMRLLGRYKPLFIHYHEYFDQQWYDQGMAIVKLYYQYEKKYLLRKAKWISHTNSFRRKLFLTEHSYLSPSKVKIMPNYPPNSWSSFTNNLRGISGKGEPIKIVYIGSLSLEHTFIEDFCTWVERQNGQVIFDVYTFNYGPYLLDYFNGLDSEYINLFNQGVDYDEIPNLLSGYDIGVILYKATTPNAKYCASNKLFEYLVCGLEVWVSKEQVGTIPYLNAKSRPRIIALDFTKIEADLIEDYLAARQLPFVNYQYHFNAAVIDFLATLKSS